MVHEVWGSTNAIEHRIHGIITSTEKYMCTHVNIVCVCVHINICIYIYTFIYLYMYIHMYRMMRQVNGDHRTSTEVAVLAAMIHKVLD